MTMLRRRLIGKTSNKYLTISPIGIVGSTLFTVGFTSDCEYNKDGEWIALSAGTTISSYEAVKFRARLTPTLENGIGTFSITGANVMVEGNAMSMLFGDEADQHTDLTGYIGAFRYLFRNCKTIVNVAKNILPATTLAQYCYSYMFYNCTNLASAPKLPAMELAPQCYSYMFYNCKALSKAPELPAMTMMNQCYHNMFRGCTSLVVAPELPALQLVSNCYYAMFTDCTNLNYIKAMFTTTPSSTTTSSWVTNVASEGTFVMNKDATWDVTGNNGIPDGWEIIKV